MCWAAMARKDDPVFNVRFVQFVEGEPCLWNYTHPGYSKKEEVQRAWQQVANEIKDTVRNCRERWRTIRSSFLRSLKLARTQTGRGKRKYYLSKYLQFLIPYTKHTCHKQLTPALTAAGMVLRKPGTGTGSGGNPLPPPADQLEINAEEHEEEEEEEEEVTKESEDEMPLDVQVSEEEPEVLVNQSREEEHHHQQQQQLEDQQHRAPPTSCLPLRLQAIKVEQPSPQHPHPQLPPNNPNANPQLDKIVSHQSLVTVPAAALGSHMDWQDLTQWFKGSTPLGGHHQHHKMSTPPPPPTATPALGGLPPGAIPMPIPSPDADYSFLISLHPYLKEMSGKQNRRFRQKVIGLIDNVLDNVDV
ncbi:hypothetical protein KR032_002228 [Drosophila birchii]|nr:hypothetical protein KR032_002228 [Drosophila birchii]